MALAGGSRQASERGKMPFSPLKSTIIIEQDNLKSISNNIVNSEKTVGHIKIIQTSQRRVPILPLFPFHLTVG